MIRKLLWCSALVLAAGACSDTAGGGRASCVPLNSGLSVCPVVDGARASFVDATPTAVLGTARVTGREDLLYVFFVDWERGHRLDAFAKEQARASLRQKGAGFTLSGPVPDQIEGMPAIRYDLIPSRGTGTSTQTEVLAFIDTGAGIALFSGSAKSAGVTADQIYMGAKTAARILDVRR